MNKILRDGVDIAVAFDSYQKRLASQVGSAASPTEAVLMSEPTAMSSTQASMSPAKAVARKVAQIAYRLLKPFVRPVAFRARRFLLDPLRNELLQEMQRMSLEVAQEMQRMSLEVAQEVQKASASTLQVVLTSAASNRQALVAHNNALLPRLDRVELYSSTTARRVAINCGNGEILIKTHMGFVVCSVSDLAIVACLADTGDLEIGTRLAIQKYLKPNDVFVDIGANVGIHTLAAAQALNGAGRIVAFEPYGPTAELLRKSVRINGYSEIVEVHQAAVSDKSGNQTLNLGSISGHHSLYPFDDNTESENNKSERVKVVTLDEVLHDSHKIDLIKIDVEGAELDVIKGAMKIINSNFDIALIVEFGPSHLTRIGQDQKDWLNTFEQFGFECRVINATTGSLDAFAHDIIKDVDSVNLFFARPKSSAWKRMS